MTIIEKTNRVRTLLQNDPRATDDMICACLSMAESRIAQAAYPFMGPDETLYMPSKYDNLQCELAARVFSRLGGLGELEHSENGISRVWESAEDIDLLRQITPYAKVV